MQFFLIKMAILKDITVKKDSGDIAIDFKNILALLENDIRDELLDKSINYDFDPENIRDKKYAVDTITSEVNKKSSDRTISKQYNEAFKNFYSGLTKILPKQHIFFLLFLKINIFYMMMKKL